MNKVDMTIIESSCGYVLEKNSIGNVTAALSTISYTIMTNLESEPDTAKCVCGLIHLLCSGDVGQSFTVRYNAETDCHDISMTLTADNMIENSLSADDKKQVVKEIKMIFDMDILLNAEKIPEPERKGILKNALESGKRELAEQAF